MRTVFFGMPGRLAGSALRALLDAGAEVVAVAVPAPPGAPPVAPAPALTAPRGLIALGPAAPPGPLALAAAHGLPALALRAMGADAVRDTLAALRPELVVVACWPWRIPTTLLALPRLGFLNLHPSPLPELRGPEPLFWALQEGRAHTAVTLHWMDAGLDSGPIAASATLELPADATWAAHEQRAASTGARLLAALLPRLADGETPRRAQGPGGSYRPAPGAADFRIAPGWSAERAFRFMRGTAEWGVPFALELDERKLLLAGAVSYDPAAQLDAPLVIQDDVAHVQLRPGVLTAALAPLGGSAQA